MKMPCFWQRSSKNQLPAAANKRKSK
jgi:hypothetical protein